MSLFHCTEWYNTIISGARSMTVAQLIGSRDQILVGSLEGTLTIIDPGGNVEQRDEMSIIVQTDLKHPILQVGIGKFLHSYEQPIIVVLHPKSLVYFRLNIENEESFLLDRVLEHRISGEPTFNMCQGYFGGSFIEQICVQSINCTLSIYEGEYRILGLQLTESIHPGPLTYSKFSESILLTSGGYLTSVRYSILTSSASLNQNEYNDNGAIGKAGLPLGKPVNKKLNKDWLLNLGDTPLDIKVIGILPIQPSIIVLCKRSVYCVTHGGTIRYVIRLQCVATCMMVNVSSREAEIQICVGVSTKTLLFYSDTRMMWAAQLPFTPIIVDISSFSESLRCLLSVLSDEFRVFIGYLGTEPSLFRMPVTESRFIDLEVRKKELREYEEIIWKYRNLTIKNIYFILNASLEYIKIKTPNNCEENNENGLKMNVEIHMDETSIAYEIGKENVPSATVSITVSGIKEKVDILLQSKIFSQQTNFTITSNDTSPVTVTMFCNNSAVLDLRCEIVVIGSTVDVTSYELILPLQLVCYEVPPQKMVTYKISLDSTHKCLSILDLFPAFLEFKNENQTSIAFQPYFSDAVVSIFVATKINRYRIQSNSTDFLFVVFSELIRRIHEKQPDVKLRCPVPLRMFLDAISNFLEMEMKHESIVKNISRIAVQMRHVETVLLGKLKSNHEPFTPHISVMVNYTYREMMSALDELAQLETTFSRQDSFKALLNLMQSVLHVSSGVPFPFGDEILDGSDQNVSEIMMSLLDPESSTQSTNFVQPNQIASDGADHLKRTNNIEEINRLIVKFCEQNLNNEEWRSGDIIEAPEENEFNESSNEKSEQEKKDVLNSGNDEFLELQGGSLPAKFSGIHTSFTE